MLRRALPFIVGGAIGVLMNYLLADTGWWWWGWVGLMLLLLLVSVPFLCLELHWYRTRKRHPFWYNEAFDTIYEIEPDSLKRESMIHYIDCMLYHYLTGEEWIALGRGPRSYFGEELELQREWIATMLAIETAKQKRIEKWREWRDKMQDERRYDV